MLVAPAPSAPANGARILRPRRNQRASLALQFYAEDITRNDQASSAPGRRHAQENAPPVGERAATKPWRS
jgi:hypothetical protein